MPAKECNNGKWKWGETGACIYDSKEAAEKDNEDYYQNAIDDEVDFTMNFTKEQMEELHSKGEVLIEVEGDDGDKMNILFTYASDETEDEIEDEDENEDEEDDRDESFDPIGPQKDEEVREEIKEEKDKSFYDTERNKPLTRKVENIWEKTITMEKRYFNIETRTEKREDGSTTITGHAAVFNKRSSDLGGFREIIAPGAFRDALSKETLDCRCLINHDPNLLLARATKDGGTLKLEETNQGLQYSFSVPDTTYGRDIIVSMERGDISQSSFAFTIEEDSWETTEDGEVRTITKIRDLWDTSIVTYPAYPDADDLTLAKRSLALHKEKEENKKEEKDLVQRSLVALKIELKKRK
jgi:HK97 family phage prohead protease